MVSFSAPLLLVGHTEQTPVQQKGPHMNDKNASGKRNLTILSWMGLACQAIGWVSVFSNFVGLQWGTLLAGMMTVTFGMAMGGWAGNLREITELKERLARLEGGAGTAAATASNH